MSAAVLNETAFRTLEIPRLGSFRPRVFVPRELIPHALLAAESTTYGWDTVNCLRLPLVNEVLAKSSYPTHLRADLNPAENWTIDTNYGPWQIASGGSGAILMMELPLTSATLTIGSNRLAFTDGWVRIALKLRFVPQPPPALLDAASTEGEPDIDNLVADAKGRSADDPAVVIHDVDYGSATPTDEQKALFEASIAQLLNANLNAFTHVFAAVNLNQKADEEHFAWLKPSYTSYAYFQGLDDASSYFAVLNQTGGHSPDGLTNQISASAIPDGMNSSILISTELFVQQMVFPGITRAFPNADAETFSVSKNGKVIEANKKVRLAPVRVGAIDYTPYMTYFRLQVVGDEIQMQSKVSIDISPGIVAYVDASYFYAIGLVEKPDGTMTLDFEESSPSLVTSWYDVAFWVTMTQLVVSIIGAVIGAVAGEAIKQVAVKIVVISIITVLAGVIAAIPSIIADVISKGAADSLPPIGPMVDEATDPVDWPKSSGFALKTAELNGAFQLGGILSLESTR